MSPNETPPRANTQDAAVKPLPDGYLWRLAVILILLLGGGACIIFYSTVIGSLLSLSGLAFGKLSGLDKMVAGYSEPPQK